MDFAIAMVVVLVLWVLVLADKDGGIPSLFPEKEEVVDADYEVLEDKK